MNVSGAPIFVFGGPWGVRVEIDRSILMLIGFFAFVSSGAVLDGLIFAAIIIASIFLHELGHAWGCLVQGIPVRRVVLHGGGGFCEHARSGTPREEELIIAMGPLVNLALWAICGIALWAMETWLFISAAWWFEVTYWLYLAGFVNLMLFAFNLIPVQPLDGGKLLHLALLRLLPPGAAHRLTGAIGLVLSVAWYPAAVWLFLTVGFVLFFFPSPLLHWRMLRGDLAF